jgi:hypothetical protein
MVDVIQVPGAADIPPILYIIITWLISMITSLVFLMIYMFRGNRSSIFGGKSESMETMMLLALLSGREDVFRKLLSYQLLSGKDDLKKNLVAANSMGGIGFTESGLPIKTGNVSDDMIRTSIDSIKGEIFSEIRDEIKKELKHSVRKEVEKKIRSKIRSK